MWLLAFSFAAYALWRLSEAAFGVVGEGSGVGPRIKALGSAVVYAALAVLTLKIITGRHSNQVRQQQDITAKVMQHTGGQCRPVAIPFTRPPIATRQAARAGRREAVRYRSMTTPASAG